MTITRNIKPILAALQKKGPGQEFIAYGQGEYGDEVYFTDKQVAAAVKREAYAIDNAIDTVIGDRDSMYMDSLDYYVLTKVELAKLIAQISKSITVYTIEDDSGEEYELSQEEIDDLDTTGLRYVFTVHGFESVLNKDILKIGCQEYSLSEWKESIDHIIDEYYGDRGYEDESKRRGDKIVKLIRKQWDEAYPVFVKLQAGLNAKPKKKPAKKKAKKAKR